MGLFQMNKTKEHSLKQTPMRGLPPDNSYMTGGPDPCHCLSDVELERRYNIQRAEEHARVDGRCGPDWSRTVGLDPANAERNRYANIIPWDHSRVKLPVKDGFCDYINASWIQMGCNTYVATQGPLPNTQGHFWQMVYAYGGNPAVIVMLTPLYEHVVEKCSKYWPDSKEVPLTFAAEKDGFEFGLKVQIEKHSSNDHYTYSMFRLVPDDGKHPPHTVHHLYYHTWLDYSKPNADADLRSLIHLINNKLKNPGAPPIIHCSAGIGRTGTFIAVDSLLAKTDTDVELSNLPETSPVWKMPISDLLNKPTPFTGDPEAHELGASPSPMNPLSTIGQQRNPVKSSSYRRPSALDPVRPSDVPLETLRETPGSSKVASPDNTRRNSYSKDEEVFLECEDQPNDSGASAGGTDPLTKRNGYPVSALTSALSKERANDHASGLATPNADTPPGSDGTAGTSVNIESPESTAKTGPACGGCSPYSGSLNNGSAKTGPVMSSSKKGPKLTKKPSEVDLTKEFLEEVPETVDVLDWFDPEDPVMSAVRCMRKQRPKMVQGKQQMGYIYDQLEIAYQLARAGPVTPRRRTSRSSTTADLASSYASTSSMASTSSRKGSGGFRLRRSSTHSESGGSDGGAGAGSANGNGGRRLLRSSTISSMFQSRRQSSAKS